LLLKGAAGAPGIAVGWQADTFSRDDLQAIAIATGSKRQLQGPARLVTTPGPDGVPVDTAVVGDGGSSVRVAAIGCGKRSVLLIAAGGFGVEALHRRVLATFRCHPNPDANAQPR
jgi:hypothetical protein